MFKFSKESQITFFSLLIIPVIWACLNYFGLLDYLKTKSVDWRMQMRGEIAQSSFDLNETIIVEGNVSIPKVPKLTYVCLLYTSPSPRDQRGSRMPSSA